MPGSTISSFIQFDLIVYRVEDYRNILKLGRKPFAVTSSKAFLKTEKRSGASLPASFSA